MNKFIHFFKEENGVSAIEYALITALVAVVIIGAVTIVGGTLSNLFQTIAGNVANVE